MRAGAHTDYGSITLLFQDMAGGLQVLSPKGTFVNATPIEDTIVVNAADLLTRWSNDTIKSTKHRVVEPPKPATPPAQQHTRLMPCRARERAALRGRQVSESSLNVVDERRALRDVPLHHSG